LPGIEKKRLLQSVPIFLMPGFFVLLPPNGGNNADQPLGTLYRSISLISDFLNLSKFKKSKGFCLEHYGMLFEEAPKYLHGNVLEDFTSDLNRVFLENYKRMEEELAWFIDKFDYRNTDAPWKTSKDAVPRAMTKVNGILSMDE